VYFTPLDLNPFLYMTDFHSLIQVNILSIIGLRGRVIHTSFWSTYALAASLLLPQFQSTVSNSDPESGADRYRLPSSHLYSCISL
jgi:hypothetical protein